MTGLDLIETAQRLHTFPSVIDALEQGDFEHLPPWPETVVVVSGFTALAGIDPRPVLTTIRERIECKIIEAQPSGVTVNGASSRARIISQRTSFEPRIGRNDPQMERTRRTAAAKGTARGAAATSDIATSAGTALVDGRRRTRKLVASSSVAISRGLQPLLKRMSALVNSTRLLLAASWRKPIALSLAVSLPLAAVVSFGSQSPLHAAVASLPQPVAGVFRSLEDYVLRSFATQRNGLVWIEVSDPRSRKTDKLPSPRR